MRKAKTIMSLALSAAMVIKHGSYSTCNGSRKAIQQTDLI